MGIELYEHNEKAYRVVRKMLDEKGLAAVVHPTGTGKSFIAFKLCEDEPDKTICWLGPSEYIFKTQLENLKAAGGGEPKNIEFYTYAKLMNMGEREIADIQPDVIVFDEFHRAGAAQWSLGVERLRRMYPNAPMLGLSATAVRYLDNKRDLCEELFNGCVASEMSLGEAIVRGILPAPKYVMASFVYQNELERLKERIDKARNGAVRSAAEQYYEALRRALEKADGLDVIFDKHMTSRAGKYIVFCANIHAMRDCMSHVSEWFGRLDAEPHVYWFYSLQPDTLSSFEDFKDDDDEQHLRLLFCIDALNEGVHVADVDGVILFRPTVSPIIYKQQIGRALSAGKTDTPVIFDIVNNFEGLYSIGYIEEEMRTAITYYKGSGDGGKIITERFKVVDEVRDYRQLFDALEEALSATWDTMYDRARQYFETFGDLDVPLKYKTEDGLSLGAWLNNQRRVYKGEIIGTLGEDRIARLNAIGMEWDYFTERSWKRHYECAQAYYMRHGDLRVPTTYVAEDGVQLGRWISNLRTYRKNGVKVRFLSPERIQALDEIGMLWNVPDYQWEINYAAAMRYHRAHGDLRVSATYVDSERVRLGQWLNKMRALRKSGSSQLTEEKIAKLDELGMIWGKGWDRKWEIGYVAAKEYYDRNGHLDVPNAYESPAGFPLGSWISDQREQYRRGKMKQDRIDRLNAIGMKWVVPSMQWEQSYLEAQRYYQEHGDLNVPARYKTDSGFGLGAWIRNMRHARREENGRRQLTQEQIARLDAIGMEWGNSYDNQWDRAYAEAASYYRQHGTLDMPVAYKSPDGLALGQWVQWQRRALQDTEKTESPRVVKRREMLDKIGMKWGA